MSLKKNKKSYQSCPTTTSLNEQYPDLSDYILLKILGSGSFGKVVHAKKPEIDQDFAIKV